MTGGLLQIVTSGKQDIYLTIKPEITFFKKVYKRHTNFSLELITITPQQTAQYNDNITFIINNGDAIHRCYLEIDLPTYNFSDNYITNPIYNERKKIEIINLKQKLSEWQYLYDNFKEYIDIEIQLYRLLYNYLQTDNISINTLKMLVYNFNNKYKSLKDMYITKIDKSIYVLIDISGYIISINLLISSIIDKNKYISINDILMTINNMYNKMYEYLKYYNDKIIFYNNKINNRTKYNQINFNFSKYLGHNFFEYFTLEIGGNEINKYTNDILHIHQMHKLTVDEMDNYLEMIGHDEKLYKFNTNTKGNRKIIVPLIFWFNNNAGASLPLVGLQYSTVVIGAKIADIRKIICFEDYEQIYEDITKITIPNTTNFIFNTKLIYNKYNLNINENSITYECLFINDELLINQFPDLTNNDINGILQNNGTKFTLNEITKIIKPNMSEYDIQILNGSNGLIISYLINKFQWIKFMSNINNSIYASKIGTYYPYINFNLYYSLIQQPIINLITEIVYFDDMERTKFADSKLEYIIEKYDYNIYTCNSNNLLFDCELSFNNPCKELIWFIQPQLYKDGLTENGQNISLLYDLTKYFVNKFVIKQELNFCQYNVLLENVDFNYYTYLLSYKYLNNILPNGIYYHSFCLYPEETQPSGTVNMRQLKSKQYRVDINPLFIKEYNLLLSSLYNDKSIIINKSNLIIKFIGKSYDLFIVHKGNGKLLFLI